MDAGMLETKCPSEFAHTERGRGKSQWHVIGLVLSLSHYEREREKVNVQQSRQPLYTGFPYTSSNSFGILMGRVS